MDKEQDIEEGLEVLIAEDTPGSEYDTSFYRPYPSRKVWVILTVIFVVIAVAVLYVYQAGDRKTILGNQPIPANRDLINVQPVAVNVPVGGGMHNHPVGAGAPGACPALPAASGATKKVQCPRCLTTGLPICAACGAVMQSLNKSGLYVCPACGSVGLPICPRCSAHMAPPGGAGNQRAVQPAANVGGQFHCPVCGATGLPNWDPNGVSTCPNCGARMQVTQGAGGGPALAAAP